MKDFRNGQERTIGDSRLRQVYYGSTAVGLGLK